MEESPDLLTSKEISDLIHWREKSLSDQFWTSPTQIDTYEMCPRKWWYAKVRKLPTPKSKATTFGDVMHEVADRYFNADDNGYDPHTGKPVDLYPEGWIKPKPKPWAPHEECIPLTVAEQSKLKRLVSAAIKEGIWTRTKGRRVERGIKFSYLKHKGVLAFMTGSIDLEEPLKIIDHKTTKSIRWAKSVKGVREAIPMRIYAYAHLLDQKDQGQEIDPESEIELQHNQFVTSDSDLRVRRTVATDTAANIQSFWHNVVCQNTAEMISYRKVAESGQDVPVAKNQYDACSAFGGCPFLKVCSGHISEEKHICKHYKIDSLPNPDGSVPEKPKSKNNNKINKTGGKMNPVLKNLMSKRTPRKPGEEQADADPQTPELNGEADKPKSGGKKGLAAKVAAKKSAKKSPKKVASKKSPKKKDSTSTNPVAKISPPWTSNDGAGCTSCSDNEVPGFNSKGEPCHICLSKARKKGILLSHFDPVVTDEGEIQYHLKEEFSHLEVYQEGIENGTVFLSGAEAAPAKAEAKQEEEQEEQEEEQLETSKPKSGKASVLSKIKGKGKAKDAKPSTPADPQPPANDLDSDLPDEDKLEEMDEEKVPSTVRGKAGRPAASFRLMVNVAFGKMPSAQKGSGRYIYCGEDLLKDGQDYVLQSFKEEMQDREEANLLEWSDLLSDHSTVFVARSRLESWTHNILAPLLKSSKDTIAFSHVGTAMSDATVVVNALKAHADTIVIGSL